MTIEQQAGPKRRIILEGRGIAFAESVRWGVEQRIDEIFLPGSPDGIAQVSGSKPKPQTPHGRWRDRYMTGQSPQCVINVNGQQLQSAMDAALLFETVCEEGILLRVAYEQIVRYGMLKDFEYGPFVEGRDLTGIDWRMEFGWLSKTPGPQLPTLPTRTGASDLAGKLAVLVQQLDAAADKASSAVDLVDGYVTQVQSKVELVRSIKNSALQAATDLSQRVTDVASIAKNVWGLCNEVKDAFNQILDVAQGTVSGEALAQIDPSKSEFDDLSERSSVGKQLAVAAWQRGVMRQAEAMFLLADQVQADVEASLKNVQPQITYAKRGENLRDIARRELGSADEWQRLASANGLSGSEVAPGEPLLIPVR